MISFDDFLKVDMRVGKILTAVAFEKARKLAFQLTIDFGELGVKRSSAQIAANYTAETLIGQHVIAVVNFPVKQIANFFSEVLVLGVTDANGNIVLLQPNQDVPLGAKVS
ncbi:MAG: tRNA-binding protein [Saprospiraceae bacterium]|nr:tRNA-binding protein [Saprospiraceae bacterium]MBP7679724.1 tRNA-binding protein [Saprospiraceae bacterium]